MPDPTPHIASLDDLTARTFHDVVRLRVDAFVVEQGCSYPELDGRDALPDTQHAWLEVDGAPVCYLRTYPADGGGTWIGRVVTDPAHRRRGLAESLLRHVLARVSRPVVIAAQSRLVAWYARLGFVPCGAEYLEDGILHTPMRLDGDATGAASPLPADL